MRIIAFGWQGGKPEELGSPLVGLALWRNIF
jgi:hypothetical protein